MIIHIMADGTVLDSIEGIVLPLNDRTRIAYELLAQMINETKMDPNEATMSALIEYLDRKK